MPYFFRPLSRRGYALALATAGGVATIAFVTPFATALQHRKETVPLFDSRAIVHTEEHARYPCRTFVGYDVVVRNYYLRTAASEGAESHNLRSRWQHFLSYFSNSRSHRFLNADGNIKDDDRPDSIDDSVNPTPISSSSSLSEANATQRAQCVCASFNQELVREVVPEAGVSHLSFVASAVWPSGTRKYSALTMEPTRAGGGDWLSRLTDAATHQSLVRCDPFASGGVNCRADTSFLCAPYLRVMLSAFLLLPSPLPRLRVAVLGVGGGALPAFVRRYFGHDTDRMDLVDAEPMCFAAAARDLGVGLERIWTERVHCCVRDAAAFLAEAAGAPRVITDGPKPPTRSAGTRMVWDALDDTSPPPPCRYDVIFVDLFVGSTPPDFLSGLPFLQTCRGALSSIGVAAFNLPGADRAFVERCRHVFGSENVFQFPVPGSSNVIILTRRADGEAVRVSRRHFYRRALELQKTYRLPCDLAAHYPIWWRIW